MEIEQIDLYAYYHIKRVEGSRGYLTCYYPEPKRLAFPTRVRPNALVIPGGAYAFVSQREGEPVVLKFLEQDYNAYLLNYSVAPMGAYPIVLLEALLASAYIHETTADHYGNPKQVIGIGFSAGGHLLGLLNSATEEEIRSLFLTREVIQLDASIFAYPLVSGVFKTPDVSGCFANLANHNLPQAESLYLENRDFHHFSPSYIWTTKEDSIVSYQNSILLQTCLTKAGIKNKLHLFSQGDHGESVLNLSVFTASKMKSLPSTNKTWMDEAFSFLEELGIHPLDK